jgi:beta-lactamase class A
VRRRAPCPRTAAAFGLAAVVACGAAGRAGAQPAGASSAPAPPAPRQRADTAALRRTLDALAGAHRGVVGYVVHNLDTGERLARDADAPYPTASLVKVPVLVALFDQVAKGRIALDDPLTVLRIDQVPGSGQLQFLHNGLALTVRDAAWLMITTSDNTATNLLLDRIGIRTVWQAMEARGLPRTKVHAKVFNRATSLAPDSSVKYGLGVTTPAEMARLFALLADGRAVGPAADSQMVEMLVHNEDQTMLQRHVEGVRAAHKTGSVDAARTECSLWFLQSRVVACVLTRENRDQRYALDAEPHLTLARMGAAIVAAWPRAAVKPAS